MHDNKEISSITKTKANYCRFFGYWSVASLSAPSSGHRRSCCRRPSSPGARQVSTPGRGECPPGGGQVYTGVAEGARQVWAANNSDVIDRKIRHRSIVEREREKYGRDKIYAVVDRSIYAGGVLERNASQHDLVASYNDLSICTSDYLLTNSQLSLTNEI